MERLPATDETAPFTDDSTVERLVATEATDELVSLSEALIWLVETFVSLNDELIWLVETFVSLNDELIWLVETMAPLSDELIWLAETFVSLSEALIWLSEVLKSLKDVLMALCESEIPDTLKVSDDTWLEITDESVPPGMNCCACAAEAPSHDVTPE